MTVPDHTCPAPLREHPGPTPDLQADKSDFLELLLPQNLPTALELEVDQQSQLRAALSGLMLALRLPDEAARLQQVSALLACIASDTSLPAEVTKTNIPAKADQVEDFDQYFHVTRIESSTPAISMLHAHLQTTHAVLTLAARTDQLPADHLRHQIAGFIEYTRLLGRVFGLGDLP